MKTYIETLEIKLEERPSEKGRQVVIDKLKYERDRAIQIIDAYHLRWSETGVKCKKGVCEHEEEIVKQIDLILNK